MTRLESYLAEAERFRTLEAEWSGFGLAKRDCDRLCQQELGYGRAAAAQRLRVADLLNRFRITPADVGDVDPSKLRLLSQRNGLPSTRAAVIKRIHELCASTMTSAAEQVRDHDDVRPRSLVTAVVRRSAGHVEVAVATERKKGQLLVIPALRWQTEDQLVAYLCGVAVQHGSIHLLDEKASERHLAGLMARLEPMRRALVVNPRVAAASMTPRQRWVRYDAGEVDELARRAVSHLNDALESDPVDPRPSALRAVDVA